MVFKCSIGDTIFKIFSVAQDPTGSVISHWSDTDWNIKVPYLNQEDHFG